MREAAHSGESASHSSTIRFGPFELDLRAGELRKEGRRIRLQEQPFQILRMLLESPEKVVLRDEIRSRLWPDDTVVEFEHSINAAVKRLRDALCDSAVKPRYIETIARRGYRLIGHVENQDSHTALPIPAPSIAVLPFANLSGEPDNEYFSDGLAEEIINNLARERGLKVMARTSAFAFKGKHEDIRKIAQTLGVNNVLEGSVRRAGSRVRVTAQFIAAADGSHLWSARFDREMADIFAIQDEIAHAISSALHVHFSGESRQYTPHLPAYEAYLKARHCMSTFTRESLARSRKFYEQSIALDPRFAEAHSGLGVSLFTSVFPGLLPARETMPMARAAAQRALDLDADSQEAHGVLGMIASAYDFDWNEAERRFGLAIAREPVPPYVRWYYAFYLNLVGRLKESTNQCVIGLRNDPLSLLVRFHYAVALLSWGRDDAGEAELRELCALYANLYQPFYLLGLSQSLRGSLADALITAEHAYSLAPWNTGTTGLLAGLRVRVGQEDRAQELLRQLLPGEEYGTPLGLLVYRLVCSEMDQAAHWAWKVLDQCDPRLITIIGLLRSPTRGVVRSVESWSSLASRLGVPREVQGESPDTVAHG
jgi:TolB-like protein